MKNLYSLTFYSSGLWLIWAGLLFISLSAYCFAFPTEKEPALFLPARFSSGEISPGGTSSNSSGEGLNVSFLNEHFAFANTEEIKWSQVSASIPTRINEAQAVVVGSKMYVFGGFDYLKSCCTPTDRAYVFDPKANSWKRIKNMPAMNDTGYGGVTHAGFTTDGTDIYFAGGYTSDNSGKRQIFGTAEVWKYEIASNTYARLPDLPMAVAAGGLQYEHGKLHWIGGTNQPRTEDLGNHYVLELNNIEKGWSTAAFLPNPRNHLSSAVHDSKIYVFGGHHGHRRDLVTQDDVHGYDIATDQWRQLADLPQPLSHMAGSTFTFGDRIFIIGGHSASLTDVRQAIAYNPSTNDWTKFTDPPTSNVSVAGVIEGVIYYVTDKGATFKGTLGKDDYDSCTPTGIWLEAECATIQGSNWQIAEAQDASEGSYIVSGLNSLESAPTAEADILSYNFKIDEAGEYHVYGRIQASDHTSNSFWIRIDDGEWMEWSVTPLTEKEVFGWFQANTYDLGTGDHKIDISYREAGTKLDKLFISSQSCPPRNQGEAATNCSAPTNKPPVADAGEDQTVAANDEGVAEINLDASASSDPDGEIISYIWKKEDEQIGEGKQAKVELALGTHEISLQVKDNHGATASDQVTIRVEEQDEHAGEPPIADAGKDTTVYADEHGVALFTLDGTASTGSHGEIISYIWKKGEDQIAEGAQAEVELPVGEHEITLEVKDDHGLTATDQVIVVVKDQTPTNDPPVADAGEDQVVEANEDGIAQVTLDGSASEDPDGSIASYIWKEGEVQIGEGVQPVVELSVGTHEITLTIEDDEGATATDQVTITVQEQSLPVAEIWLEAECAATMGSKWMQIDDASASEGSYIAMQEGFVGADNPPDNASDIVTYHFDIIQSGAYHIFSRVKASPEETTVFWVRVDEGSWMQWEVSPGNDGFDWVSLQDAPFAFDVEGTHTLEVAYRQGNAWLDKLYITSAATPPDGAGGAAANCDGSTTIVGMDGYEQLTMADVTVFPNPGKDVFTLRFSDNTVYMGGKLTVSTIQGELVKQMNFKFSPSQTLTIDLEDIASGVYLLQIQTKREVVVKRIEKF